MLALEPESIISGQRIIAYVKMLYCLIDMLANLAGLFVRRSGGCSLPTTIIISWFSEGRKLRLLTVRSVMMSVRDWLWLPIEDRSSSLLKKANTLFCQVEALSRSLVNSCSSLSPCESKFQAIDNAKDGASLLSTVSPISLPRRFCRCCLRDTRDSPFALPAAYMPSLLQTSS